MWDLEGQYCIKTVVGFRSPIQALCPITLQYAEKKGGHKIKLRILNATKDSFLRAIEHDGDNGFELMNGEINRKSAEKVSNIVHSSNGLFVAIQTKGKVVEIYRIRSESEIKRKRKRRLKRLAEKEQQSNKESPQPESIADELEFFCLLRTKQDIKSVAFGNFHFNQNKFEVVLALKTNIVQFYNVEFDIKSNDSGHNKRKPDLLKKSNTKGIKLVSFTKRKEIGLYGHRSDVRCCALHFEQDILLLTADTIGELKLWNLLTGRVLRNSKLSGTKE